SKMALAQAKKALIAYAAMRAAKTPPPVKMYGKLPCPYNGPFRNTVAPLADYGEGAVEDPTCSVSLGFLPWQTLGLPPLLDGDLAPVWYALAPRFATGYATKDGFLCNQADLTINGDTSRYAAILLAPGQVLSLTAGIQNRSVNVIAQNLVQGYLEEDNADGDSTYEIRKIIQENSGDPNNPPFNDRLLGITCTEILNAMARL
ncbi:MAG TPA: hypothetical protein HPQ00_10330, partial [Magnetococcales bacterium]|nr:hypothetical protein [Magnetococcales bacterium]